ncbi:MAG: beta-propeller fold lactonase family protein [Acidobacteriota bacterium]
MSRPFPLKLVLLALAFSRLCPGLPAAGRTLVVNNSSNNVTVFDLQTNSSLGTIPVGNAPTEVYFSSDNRLGYVPNYNSNSVSVLDLEHQIVTATIPVGVGPSALILSRNDRIGYVVNSGSNDLTVFDSLTQTVIETISVGVTPVSINISSDGLHLFIANQDSNSVTVVDTSSRRVTATIPVGSQPNQVGLTPDNRLAYAVNTGSGSVSVIDTVTFSVVATIAVGNNPVGLAFSNDGQFGYVTNRGSNTVSKIDVPQNAVLSTIPVGSQPVGIALSGDGRYAYVSNSGSANVTVFDTQDAANSELIPVGQSPFSIVFEPDESYVYVTNLGSNTVSVIDTNTDRVVKTAGVGTSPVQFAFLQAPTVLGISQDQGPVGGGTALQIIGHGFVEGVRVEFGGSLATVEAFSPHALRVITGSHGPGTVEVNVVNPDNASDSLPQAFTFRGGPLNFQLVFPSSLDTAAFRTNLGLNNLSGSSVNVKVSLVGSGGTTQGSQTYAVPPGGLNQIGDINRKLLAQGNVTDSSGSLVVEASQPISGFVSVIDNVSQDPSLEVPFRTGDSTLLIPSVTNRGAFRSDLVVRNLSSSSTTLQLTARDTAGNVVATRSNLFVPGRGMFETSNILGFLGATDQFGPLEVRSATGQSLTATSRVYSDNPGGGTNGGFLEGQPLAAGRSLYVPFVIDTASFRTNLGLNNPGTLSSRVAVFLYGQNGELLASGTTSVPAGGMTQINSIVRKLLSNAGLVDLAAVPDPGTPAEKTGYLHILSSRPLVAWASQIDNSNNDPSLELARPYGFVKLLLPSSTNRGLFRSTLALLNTRTSAAQVQIVARNTDGNQQASTTVAVPPNGLLSEDDILTSLGLTDTFGPLEVEVTNGIPLIAISRVYSTNGTSAFFESRPVD